jgi:predicted transcriptional regulator
MSLLNKDRSAYKRKLRKIKLAEKMSLLKSSGSAYIRKLHQRGLMRVKSSVNKGGRLMPPALLQIRSGTVKKSIKNYKNK